jgi:hypothetical protein
MERKMWMWPEERGPEMLSGPWANEPDKVQWPDPKTGLACMIRRGPLGAWCGYVGVDETHPLFGVGYMDVEERFDIDVHGGLTYSNACDGDEDRGICHVPGPGEPESLWWLGFDCGHAFDLVPRMTGKGLSPFSDHDVYRDVDYVTAETMRLAAQIAEVKQHASTYDG